ncbi:MAG TPA: PRC-barrel domain-containing protein [Pirellulales bacterium]|nr:PRC-barrel domain-containing protein [Pirellulales bacterium]
MRNSLIVSATMLALGVVGPAWSAHAADTKIKKTDSATVLRAYDMMGMNVRNAAGESLGEVKDLMVDLQHPARVRYAAVSYGGFLGVGNKLFAVPWNAMKLRHDADNAQRAFLELDVSKESLKNAPGFDKDKWPNFADAHWADEVHKHYRVHSENANVDIDVKRKEAPPAKNAPTAMLRRASKVEGIEVKNEENQKIGKVEDLAIDANSGKIRYVALSFGGFLGAGDKLFAVPWDAVMFEYDAKDKKDCLIFDVSKDTLTNAPGFDKDHWPNFGDKKWSDETERHYKTHVEKAASRAKERRG